MNRNAMNIFLAAAAVLAVSGCNLILTNASGDLPVEALAKTAVYQTLSAGNGDALPTADSLNLTELALPTDTPTPTPTYTPTATLSPTPEKVTVTVTRNTNCRTGPEKQFDLAGIMMVGETAEAIGRNDAKTYWVIRLPSNTAKTCWLWYEWATLTGNGDALPIVQSPPTPTWSPKPDFSFSYLGLTSCGANRIIRLQVINTGNVPWESFRVQSEDTVTAAITSYNANIFLDYSGCTPLAGPEALAPGETNNAVGVVPVGSSGHNVVVKLTLYTDDSGGGTPMTGNFNMTIP